jgi:acyl carrier protein
MSTLDTLVDILTRDYCVAREQITPEATLETLGLDSLSVLELMFKIEDRYKVKITDDTPTDLLTVSDVVRYIDSLLAGTLRRTIQPIGSFDRHMTLRRVAVTGLGVVAPLGNSVEEFWKNLVAGRSGVHRLPSSISQGLRSPIGASVNFDGKDYFEPPRLRLLDRVSQLALVAARASDRGLPIGLRR